MKIIFVSISICLIVIFCAFNDRRGKTNYLDLKKNIRFNHLFVVVDDSTYKYLFDSLKCLKQLAKTSEQTVNAGDAPWTGKYIEGINNYIEIFKPGGMKGSKLGDLGIGFMTNKFGTIDSLQNYWMRKLDSVHVENKVITDNGKTSPWFKTVSVPNIDQVKISAWVIENSKDEMTYAGFKENDLLRVIEYPEYVKHITAKLRNIPVDSIKDDRLFNKITSLGLMLSGKELAYLKNFLLDIGFKERNNSFLNEDLKITYSLSESKHAVLKEIGFSLLKKVSKEKYSFSKIEMTVDGHKAKMRFKDQ